MAQMLRHKVTGELFVYTELLSRLSELEFVVEDPVAAVIAEIQAKIKASEPTDMEIPVFAPGTPAEEVAMKSTPGYMSNKDKGRKAK